VTPLSEAIRRFAEEPEHEIGDPPPPTRRITRPTFTIMLSPTPTLATVSRVRTTAERLDETIAETRAILHEHGYVGCSWYLGPSCRPEGIARLLVERGFAPAVKPPSEPRFTAMALTTPPPSSPRDAGIEARVVRDLEEYVRALRVGLESFNESDENIARWIDAAPTLWNDGNGIARLTNIAYLEGRVAGFGFVAPGPVAVLLGGGAVVPAARGRGVYRALVASRWAEAVKLGTPALTVHAGAMSRPILERCGFQEVCRVDVLADTTLG
jgi:GNAT superfamily N-acetyltransferase